MSPSVLVHVTVVAPMGKNEPFVGVQMMVAQSPVVTGGGEFTTAPHWPGVLFVVTFVVETRKHVLVTFMVTIAGPEMFVPLSPW